MTEKSRLLKRHVLASINRLKGFVERDDPTPVIGMEAWLLFRTVLAAYGAESAYCMLHDLRDSALHSRGLCSNGDCANEVERPNSDICPPCEKLLGLDEESLAALDTAANEEYDEPHRDEFDPGIPKPGM